MSWRSFLDPSDPQPQTREPHSCTNSISPDRGPDPTKTPKAELHELAIDGITKNPEYGREYRFQRQTSLEMTKEVRFLFVCMG